MKRFTALVLCLALTVLLAVPAVAAGQLEQVNTYTSDTFTDVPQGSWCEEYVKTAYEYGLINGMGDGRYAPGNYVELSAVVTVAARVRSAWMGDGQTFAAENGAAWYEPYYDYMVGKGLLSSADYPLSCMEEKATRYQVADILADTLPESCYEEINNVDAIPDVEDDNAVSADVYLLYRAGILTGDENSYYNGSKLIERSEMAAAITRLAELSPRKRVIMKPVGVKSEHCVELDGKVVYIGMTTDELIAVLGQPDAVESSIEKSRCYVFGTDDYSALCLAYVSDGKVWQLIAAGSRAAHLGANIGDTEYTGYDGVRFYTDQNDSGRVFMIIVKDSSRYGYEYTEEAMRGEEKLQLHLTNAFREYYGLASLAWNDTAAGVARSYSQLMADENFFSHYGKDGNSTPMERMQAAGIRNMRICGENIAAGYGPAWYVHYGWVNSSGHRSNILQKSYTYLGIGLIHSSSSSYGTYWTQNFWG